MLTIRSQSHPYDVIESRSALAAISDVPDHERAFFLVDRKVADLYRAEIANALPRDRCYYIDASEHAKSYEQLEPVFCWLLEKKFRRSTTLIVIGGGVLQDIGCFIASVLARGVRWVLLPTTLLAQCDSCIGSKSSLNIGRFKNQLGTFYPPHEIRLSIEFLHTLSDEEIFSGLGEAIKLHLIDGPESCLALRQMLASPQTTISSLRDVVLASLKIKQRFIEEDEFDLGIRNLLNYGHTFAHAFESATSYAIPHGIAVTMGLVFATYFADRIKLADSGYFEDVLAWTQPYFARYITTLREVPFGKVVEAMKQDKKNHGEQVTFILSKRPGIMEKVTLDVQTVSALLQDCQKVL